VDENAVDSKDAVKIEYEKGSVTKDSNDKYRIQFGARIYEFDLSDTELTNTPETANLVRLLHESERLIGLFDKKSAADKEGAILKVTDHYHFTALEYLFFRWSERLERARAQKKAASDNNSNNNNSTNNSTNDTNNTDKAASAPQASSTL
jgi:hypothetical protein